MADPKVKTIGSSVWVLFEDQVTFEFARIVDHSDALSAETTARHPTFKEVEWSRVNLASTVSRNTFAKACESRAPGVGWGPIVYHACRAASKHIREGDPGEDLAAQPLNGSQYLVEGLIPRDEITVLYGPSMAGKSLITLAIAVAGLQGHPLTRAWSVGPLSCVHLLDWETNKPTVSARLWALTDGRECLDPGRIVYRRMRAPLTDALDAVRAEADRREVDCVIVDSFVLASGAEPESTDAATRTMRALQVLPGTKLVVSHLSKLAVDGEGPARPFGSIFVENIPRSTIELRAEEDGVDKVLTLHHRKANDGVLQAPTALRCHWDPDGHVTFSSAEPDLSAASLMARIRACLQVGSRTVTDLAEELGEKVGTIRVALFRAQQRHIVVRVVTGGSGKGDKTQWGLLLPKRYTERD